MTSIPHRSLCRVSEWLLRVYGCGEQAALGRCMTDLVGDLIPCDRASFNEVDLDPHKLRIAPVPAPSWWEQYSDVYQQHLLDHPLCNPDYARQDRPSFCLRDPHYRAFWEHSPLNWEYFRPLGIRHQLTIQVFRRGTHFVGLGVNRSATPFRESDRLLLDLVAPHLSLAWENLLRFSSVWEDEESRRMTSGGGTLVARVASGRIQLLHVPASAMLERWFDRTAESPERLPGDLHRWLRAEAAQRGRPTSLMERMPTVFTLARRDSRLVVRLVRLDHDEATLELEEALTRDPSPSAGALPDLTPRENEVVRWMAEGKRNFEIGIILGVSSRTVEKHVEHILEKLGVETRTAAVREAQERHRQGC